MRQLLARNERRLVVSLDHLRETSRDKWTSLINEPMDYLPAFEKALKETVLSLAGPDQQEAKNEDYYVGMDGAIPQHEVNPRTLFAHLLGKTVILEGIVTRCRAAGRLLLVCDRGPPTWVITHYASFAFIYTAPMTPCAHLRQRDIHTATWIPRHSYHAMNAGSLVRPKVRKSVHYCEATKNFHFREYHDATMIGSDVPVSSVYPTTVGGREGSAVTDYSASLLPCLLLVFLLAAMHVHTHLQDENNNRLETEFGFCRYVDFQTITIQEMPERAPAGQLPRSVDIVLNADLVDRVKPGDRVKVYGVYRSMGGIQAGSTNAVFR